MFQRLALVADAAFTLGPGEMRYLPAVCVDPALEPPPRLDDEQGLRYHGAGLPPDVAVEGRSDPDGQRFYLGFRCRPGATGERRVELRGGTTFAPGAAPPRGPGRDLLAAPRFTPAPACAPGLTCWEMSPELAAALDPAEAGKPTLLFGLRRPKAYDPERMATHGTGERATRAAFFFLNDQDRFEVLWSYTGKKLFEALSDFPLCDRDGQPILGEVKGTRRRRFPAPTAAQRACMTDPAARRALMQKELRKIDNPDRPRPKHDRATAELLAERLAAHPDVKLLYILVGPRGADAGPYLTAGAEVHHIHWGRP